MAAFVSGLIEQATQAAATPRSLVIEAQAQEPVTEARVSEPVTADHVPHPVASGLVREALAVVAEREQPPRSAERTPALTTDRGADPVPSTVATMPSSAPTGWMRWTLRRLVKAVEEKFGRKVSCETLRRVLHKAKLSWKKAKKILGRADPEQRTAFVEEVRKLLDRVLHDETLVLTYIDEAHVHPDADLGYGWSPRGNRVYVASSSPGLKAKVSLLRHLRVQRARRAHLALRASQRGPHR